MLKNKEMIFRSLNEYRDYDDGIQTEHFVFNTKDFPEMPFGVNGNGEMVLKTPKGEYAFRETALNSTLCRLGLSGEAFRDRRTTDKQIANVLNEMTHMLPNFVVVMIADGAINSINSTEYKHIPMSEILDETEMMISPYYKGEIDCEVLASYASTYIKFFTDKRFRFNGKDRKLIITLNNSENGSSSIRYGAFIGRNMLPVMNDISIMHRSGASIEKVQNSLNELEAVITQAVNALKLLEKKQLAAPVSAARKFGKEVGIPKKYVDEVCDELNNIGMAYTAADVYEKFTEAVMSGRESSTIQERYKNNLLKLVAVDWDRFAKKTA